jgi:rubrerythrin
VVVSLPLIARAQNVSRDIAASGVSEVEFNGCPECGTQLVRASACVNCPGCGWGRCG